MIVKYTFLGFLTPTFIAKASFTKVTFSSKMQVKTTNMLVTYTSLGSLTPTFIAKASFTKVIFSSKNSSKNNEYVRKMYLPWLCDAYFNC
jgi:hypothetical protein